LGISGLIDGIAKFFQNLVLTFYAYGDMRDYEMIFYRFTPTLITSHQPSKTYETRMHHVLCVEHFSFAESV
jgi:hypothetical protein